MRLAQLRSKIAPLLSITDDNLRVRQQMLYQQPTLRAVLPGRAAAGDREGLLATAGATGLVLLAAMLGKTRDSIGPAVVQLWEAPCVSTGKVRVMADIKLCGAGLMLLLQNAELRSRLDCLELNQDTPELVFIWSDGRRSIFAPFTPKEWRRRVAEVKKTGLSHIVRLPANSVDKIADLLK